MSHAANAGDTDWYGRTRCVRFLSGKCVKTPFSVFAVGLQRAPCSSPHWHDFLKQTNGLRRADVCIAPAKSLYFFLNLLTHPRASLGLSPCSPWTLLGLSLCHHCAMKGILPASDLSIFRRVPLLSSFLLPIFVLTAGFGIPKAPSAEAVG